MSQDQLNAIVCKILEVAPGLIIMRVKPDGWELPDFKPGQYAAIGLPGSAPRLDLSDDEDETPDPDKIIKRAYSIASSSKEKEHIEFYITLIRSGALTPRLFALKEGDRMFLSQKYKGIFTSKNVPVEQSLVMIATGTGLAPYMSMIRTEFHDHPDRRFAIIHGARHSWDLGYRSELETMDSQHENFIYIPVISRPELEKSGWTGASGYVQDVWKSGAIQSGWDAPPTPDDTHIFLCGAPGMIQAMEEILTGEGYKEHTKKSPGQLHMEKFW